MKMTIVPKSFWVAYALLNASPVERMLPTNLELAPVRLLADDDHHEPLLLFNAYTVRARWMRGQRVDVQVFARHRETRRPHLVVLDVISTTLDWNPADGIRPPNARAAPAAGDDFHLVTGARDAFHIRAAPVGTSEIDLDFAVEANRECFFRGHDAAFKMTFNETSIGLPVETLSGDVTNSLWRSCRAAEPSHLFAHAHEMQFDVHVNRLFW